jgi:hypothetical protein
MGKEIDMNTDFSTGSTNRGSLGQTFEDNWVPLSLIGVGIAWLIAGNTGLAERVAHDERVQAARRRVGEIAGDIGIGGASKTESDTSRSGQLLGPTGEPALLTSATDRSEGWVHQAAGAARGAISSVRDAGSAVLDRASKYTEYVSDAGGLAQRAGDPWLIGVFGLVAGALLAAVVPPTSVEQDYIGEARESLRNKANEIGHDAAERVRELAEATTQGARQS